MSGPRQVLPLAREGGYWLFRNGEGVFVLLQMDAAKVIPFPRRDRAIEGAVGREIERALGGPAGDQ